MVEREVSYAGGMRRSHGRSEKPMSFADPFDRLLVAQAIHEPARFLTVDPVLSQYTHWVEIIKA